MSKLKKLFVFRPVDGRYLDADGNIMADVLADYGLTIDGRTQFARLYDYDAMELYEFRAYSAYKISLTIYPIERI